MAHDLKLNEQLLAQLHRCRRPQQRLRRPDPLGMADLRLVHRVAPAQQGKGQLAYEDLVSVGCIGLIKAIERFDPTRGLSLSTVAVPFIRGAMQHEERDRNQPIKTPRRLRELQQRVCSLQQRRHGQGLPPLGDGALARALGCRLEQLRDAAAVQRALRLRSLDAPLASEPGTDGALTLLDVVSEAVVA